MRTQTKYEEITLGEIRTLPQAVKMLRSLREGVKSVVGRVGRKSAADTERTGFCGVWKDDRPADEIIRILPPTAAVMAEERSIFPKGNKHIEQDEGICPYFPVR